MSLSIHCGQVVPYSSIIFCYILVQVMTVVVQHHAIIRTYDDTDVIKWKHFPRYWPFVWGIHRSPVNSLQKGKWRGALIFLSLICVWIYGWENNREAGDLRHYSVHFEVIVMNANLLPNMHIGTHSSKVRIQLKWLLLTKMHSKNSPSFCSNFNVLTILSSVTAMPTNASLIHEPLMIWYCTERISKTS